MNSADDIAQQKSELRWQMLDKRDAMDENLRAQYSRGITRQLLALPDYLSAHAVLAYMNIGSEFDTGEFIRAVLADGKILALPKVNKAKKTLDIYRVEDPVHDLISGVWGILEPNEVKCKPMAISEMDFVLVPGIAFDARGSRIGYGGGYYDKLLAARDKKQRLISAAYSMQIVQQVPTLTHDIIVDKLITETSI